LQEPNVWNDPERAQALGKERAQLEAVVNRLENLDRSLNEVAELLALAGEEGDEAAVAEVVGDLENCARIVADLEFQRMFSGELDASNAFVDIQAGSGGTEAQDWAEMLLRMYLRWGERRGFTTELLEVSPGEVSIRRICAWMCIALPGRAVSMSTALNRRCASPICRRIRWCSARMTVPSIRTALLR